MLYLYTLINIFRFDAWLSARVAPSRCGLFLMNSVAVLFAKRQTHGPHVGLGIAECLVQFDEVFVDIGLVRVFVTHDLKVRVELRGNSIDCFSPKKRPEKWPQTWPEMTFETIGSINFQIETFCPVFGPFYIPY